MRKAKVIRGEKLEFEKGYEPPLTAKRGICSRTVENPMMTVTHVIIPPGGRNQRHYHVRFDAGMYLLKGRLRCFIGPDHEMEEFVVEPGDFVFVPRGEIHGLMNLSDTETAELIAVEAIVGNIRKEDTVLVEPPMG